VWARTTPEPRFVTASQAAKQMQTAPDRMAAVWTAFSHAVAGPKGVPKNAGHAASERTTTGVSSQSASRTVMATSWSMLDASTSRRSDARSERRSSTKSTKSAASPAACALAYPLISGVVIPFVWRRTRFQSVAWHSRATSPAVCSTIRARNEGTSDIRTALRRLLRLIRGHRQKTEMGLQEEIEYFVDWKTGKT
jgi:hypothetical protein